MNHLFHPFLWLSSASPPACGATFQQEALHLKNDISAQRELIIISCEVTLSESLCRRASILPTQKHKQPYAAAV